MPLKNIPRRKFLSQSVKAAAVFSIVPRFVLGGRGYIPPSDKLNIGFIGTGKQGRILLKYFGTKVQTVAGADVDSRKLELFKNTAEKMYADANAQSDWKGITTYGDFRELLKRKDIDGVVVATPDHWHAVMSIMAANAGKHVYCEKPLAHSIEEGRAMVNAVRNNKVILQTGSMQRSNKNFRTACELVYNGYLGDIQQVLVNVGKPAVACDLPAQPVPAALNWDMWLGPAGKHGFNEEIAPPVEQDIYPHWRNYKEFGGGLLSDWGAHMFDIAQWALGMDNSGPLKFYPPDGKNFKSLTMMYENGVLMKHEDFGRNYAVRFIGEKGSLDISRSFLESNPANIVTAAPGPNDKRLYASDDHYQDWIDAIKNNKLPICDVETGHRTSSLCSLANIAYWLNRPLEWDPVKEEFVDDKKANKLTKASIRGPWKLV
ncbi:MAG: Gfo/Idh/MocA family oxidoreductase [Bacteroidetes bacterium]|nr:Gfo/Idh/MocA family oxidoreductase [Bacteroidota bacterium]